MMHCIHDTVDGPAKSPVENGGKHPMISHDLEGFNMFEPSKTGAGFRRPIVEALGVSLRDLDHESRYEIICCFGWIFLS